MLWMFFFTNPVIALVVVAIVYIIADRQFIGFLPDFIQPLRRWRKIAILKRDVEYSNCRGLTYYELGALQAESGDMVGARPNLEKAEELIPEHPDIEYYLGVARIKTGALDAGKEALDNALGLNPKIKYGLPYVHLIEYNLKKHESPEQLEGYMKKIYEYENPELFYETGVIFQREGRKEQALEMFRQVQASLKLCPRFLRKQHRYRAIKAKIKSMLI